MHCRSTTANFRLSWLLRGGFAHESSGLLFEEKEIADGSSEIAVWAAALGALSARSRRFLAALPACMSTAFYPSMSSFDAAVVSTKTCSSSCGTSAQDGTGGKGAPCMIPAFF